MARSVIFDRKIVADKEYVPGVEYVVSDALYQDMKKFVIVDRGEVFDPKSTEVPTEPPNPGEEKPVDPPNPEGKTPDKTENPEDEKNGKKNK